ncbi:MAG: hypothetical protein ACREU6_11670 [Steroidobacteraceae bacterium]
MTIALQHVFDTPHQSSPAGTSARRPSSRPGSRRLSPSAR